MLKSTHHKVLEKIHKYITENVDHEYFDITSDPDFHTACKLILSACENEKQHIQYSSRFSMFREWMQGLPSAFNAMYFYNVSAVDLLADWLEETENEKSKYSESEATERITRMLFRELQKGER